MKARDLQLIDIGSGVYSRTFPQADRLVTTSKGGPRLGDAHSRKAWDLLAGRVVDKCVIEETTDIRLNRFLGKLDDIRAELTLKNAL